jgi:hypothetical protein
MKRFLSLALGVMAAAGGFVIVALAAIPLMIATNLGQE